MRWIGKETLVSFEEGRVGKEAIIWVGGVVDVRLSCGPADRRLGLEVIDFVRVISRGNCYGGLRGGGVVSAILFAERVIGSIKA